jgi:hypothetical protein
MEPAFHEPRSVFLALSGTFLTTPLPDGPEPDGPTPDGPVPEARPGPRSPNQAHLGGLAVAFASSS